MQHLPPIPPLNGGGGGRRQRIRVNEYILVFSILIHVGCVFHGCPFCYPHDRNTTKHPSTNQTIQELFELTKKRERELKDMGYSLVIIYMGTSI